MKIILSLFVFAMFAGCASPSLESEPVTKLDWQCDSDGASASLRCVPRTAEAQKARKPSAEVSRQQHPSAEKFD